MADDELIIRLIGREEYISAASFITVVHNTLAILKEVDAEISEQRLGSLMWRIKDVSLNSPLTVTLLGESRVDELDYGRDVIEAYTEGLRQIDRSPENIPPFFTIAALSQAKRLVAVLNDGIERIFFSLPEQEPVVPTQRVAANVDELTQVYEELTTFEGGLDSVTLHGKRIFYVWDVFDGRIACRFPKDMLDQVRTLLGERVSVYGKARFSRAGKPLSIEIVEARRLPSQEELAQLKDFTGINITNGESSEAYVRSLRDAE
jgi:hypothetical protein